MHGGIYEILNILLVYYILLFLLYAVTEEEVYRGILSQPNAKDHCLCFERRLVDIDLHHPKVSRFVELEKPGLLIYSV